MKLWLLTPVKPFDESKSRLAAVLSRAGRAELTRALLERTLQVARDSGRFTGLLVVSRDDAALRLAAAAGAQAVQERRAGLNAALRQACEQARIEGADAALILPADLPYLTAGDIDLVLAAAQPMVDVVIAPSQDGGTNALLLRLPPRLPLCFGPDSFRRHRQAAAAAGLAVAVCTSPTLAFDLDRPEDWEVLQAGGISVGR
jgi:2-phospho-L-lactate guanylyltransferase